MIKKLFLFLIRIYQLTASFYIGGRCRFYPSCSQYATDALKRHKIAKAFFMIIKRLFKCHPLNAGGVDFVP